MTDTALLDAAARELAVSGADGSLCAPLVVALPIDSASVSTLADPFESENVCSSDATAARITQVQIDLGQGPAWTAMRDRSPVAAAGEVERSRRWPIFAAAIGRESVRSIHAFPLSVGTLDIGAIALYSDVLDTMSAEDVVGASRLASIVASQVLRRSLDRIDPAQDGTSDPRWSSRREVHQATGMLIAHLAISPDDALAVLRGHAFALGLPVLEVAQGVLARRLLIYPSSATDET